MTQADEKRIAAAIRNIGAGSVIELRHVHEADCPMPQGGPCICPNGPDVEVIDRSDLMAKADRAWPPAGPRIAPTPNPRGDRA